MESQNYNSSDIVPVALVAVGYAVIYIPHILGPDPLAYRRAVQQNTRYVASALAQGEIPYTPPYPDFYSTAGGHLHGVLGAPFQLLFDFPTAHRLGTLIMGLCSLFLFYMVLRQIGVSRLSGWLVTGLLLIYPQYILFHAGGNPAAADLFFGIIAVYAYLRWRSEETTQWLAVSAAGSGLATFSHFYSGVVAVGILLHYLLTTGDSTRGKTRTVAAYSAGMLPAFALLITYKAVFAQADPASHYFDRLIYNSFESLYATERVYGEEFSVFSNRFLYNFFTQHTGKSPIFGEWIVTAIVALVMVFGTHFNNIKENSGIFLTTWVVSGALIVVLIPGGVIYHDYYTWWLLVGTVAGVGWSIDGLLASWHRKISTANAVFLVLVLVLLSSLLFLSVTSSLLPVGL